MNIPAHLLSFWYPEALKFFIRVWKNLLSIIEEDLALGLMIKLLFVPLFHDSSIVGKIMSFFFRLARISLGLLGYFVTTILIFIISFYWFIAPIAVPLSIINQFFLPIDPFKGTSHLTPLLIFGLALFIHHLISHPLKKLWQIKDVKDLMVASRVSEKDLTWGGLYSSNDVKEILKSLEIGNFSFSTQHIHISDQLKLKAWDLGKKSGAKYLTPGYFWVAMLYEVPNVEEELLKVDLHLEDFAGALLLIEHKRNKWRRFFIWDEEFSIRHLKGTNRGWLSAPTPFLDSISTDLTMQAAKEGFDEFVGREHLVGEVVKILSQEKDRNVLLVGPPGAGKTSLVKFIASKIIAGDAPDSLATKRVVSLDLPKLLSGTVSQGALAQKLNMAFDEVEFVEDIIIFVDEIHNLGIGEAGYQNNLYSLLSPYLESNKFQFISATEEDNFERILEKNQSFIRLFNKVEVPPVSEKETLEIILDKAIDLARHKKIYISYLAIKELVEKSSKLIHDKVLPDSALQILENCEVETQDNNITAEIVKRVISKKVNVPIGDLDTHQKQLVLNLEEIIHQRLIDQEEAVKKVADTLRRSATNLKDDKRPIGSFLFVGPTGVGKTELSKTLSEIYFKTSGAFLRFDMSEYQTPEAINRLIGTIDHPGELTEAIEHRPYALLLLDEFEKADSKILNLFLQVLEDGRLTDGSGKHVDFTNTIIIATSNAASLTIAENLKTGKSVEDINAQVKNELLKVFEPELLNRFDSVVIFKPLSESDLEKIVKIKLEMLKNIIKETGYLVEFNEDLVAELSKKGFDPVMGARPLRRLIQDTLEANLSRLILEGKMKKGEVTTIGSEILQT